METYQEFMDRLHCSQTSFDQLARQYWSLSKDRRPRPPRCKACADIQAEIEKRCDRLLQQSEKFRDVRSKDYDHTKALMVEEAMCEMEALLDWMEEQ